MLAGRGGLGAIGVAETLGERVLVIAVGARAAPRKVDAGAERREGADRYAVETLSAMERQLDEQLGVVRNGIRALSKREFIEEEEARD